MTRRAARKDENHNQIAAALEAAGAIVFDTSRVGGGFVDMIAVLPSGQTWLIEVKQPEGRFTVPEVQFAVRLTRPEYRVFTSPKQAAEAMRNGIK